MHETRLKVHGIGHKGKILQIADCADLKARSQRSEVGDQRADDSKQELRSS
jgi:hypothetical protein